MSCIHFNAIFEVMPIIDRKKILIDMDCRRPPGFQSPNHHDHNICYKECLIIHHSTTISWLRKVVTVVLPLPSDWHYSTYVTYVITRAICNGPSMKFSILSELVGLYIAVVVE